MTVFVLVNKFRIGKIKLSFLMIYFTLPSRPQFLLHQHGVLARALPNPPTTTQELTIITILQTMIYTQILCHHFRLIPSLTTTKSHTNLTVMGMPPKSIKIIKAVIYVSLWHFLTANIKLISLLIILT